MLDTTFLYSALVSLEILDMRWSLVDRTVPARELKESHASVFGLVRGPAAGRLMRRSI